MEVYEAVRSRHSVRAFTDRPVPREAICRVLSEAAWAPSGSNIQPWHVYVLTGAPLAELKRLAGERVALEARQRAASANWQFFGAPVGLFLYIDHSMGEPQWADVGMYLQTVMLLLRAEGLHSCPQMAWSVYRKTVAKVLSPPKDLMLYCGMSIGYEDVTVDQPRTGRAPLDETVTFVGDRFCDVAPSPGLPAASV